MLSTKPLHHYISQTNVVSQVLAAIIKNKPFETTLKGFVLTSETVSEVLRSIPRCLFQSPRSIGRQSSFRHRSPLKQRNLRQESVKSRQGLPVLGPAAYRDPEKVVLGLDKALEFFYWAENNLGFVHNEKTCKEMAIVLAKGCLLNLRPLWEFLKNMSKRGLVNTASMTCVIKVLGEEGLVNEALAAFYRMKQFHCKPDVYAYNTIIYALCRVGYFRKAKFLFEQMELPGFRCPPDTFTYTILISSYCRYSMETGCKKAIRRRMWEANHLFRIMLFNGFVPDVVTYNCLINGCCKTYRIDRALELFDDMVKRGCLPNQVTYNSFVRFYSAVNEIDKAIEMLRRMEKNKHGVPTTSSYTPVIHSLCEAGRAVEAWDLLIELVERGSIPREYTYKIVCDALRSFGKMDLLDLELCKRIEDGIESRIRQVMKVKPIVCRETTI